MTTRTCDRQDCTGRVVGRGLCRPHYLQEWRAGTVSDRAVKAAERHECPTEGAEHTHTADGCWTTHGCRCTRCVHSRKMDQQRRRNRLRAYGLADQIQTRREPAEPAREHLAALLAAGIGLERIADAASIPRSVLLDLRYGRRGKAADPATRVLTTLPAEYSDALLALTADDITRAILPSVGTVRRLRALVAIGWTQSEISARMGMYVGNFSRLILGYRPRVTAATAEAAASLFDELWAKPRTGAWADNARKVASARSWVGPLAWDDIDADPEPAVAESSEQTKGERVLEDVEWLLEAGEPAEQIALTLDRTAGSISKLAERHGRIDLARHFWALANRDQGAA